MKVQRNERGQTTIFFVFFLGLVFMGMAALAIDVGVLYRERRVVQAAADAAAIAASAQYSATGNASIVTSAAKTAAQQQAGGILPGEVTPTLVSPANADVKVVIAHPTDTMFLGVLNSAWKTINVSAMAEAAIPAPSYGLNTNNLTLNSGTNISDAAGSTCGVNDNDSDGSALSLNDKVTVDVGSFTDHGTGINKNCGSNLCAGYQPYPTTGTAVVADPYSSLIAPAAPSSNGTSATSNGVTSYTPGNWPSGITFSGSNTLAAGLYYMGSNVIINSGATITGDGVTIYLASGGINSNSVSTIKLTAPTSALSNCASCSGMQIWEAKGNSSDVNLDAGSSSSFGGEIYLPSGKLTLNGDSTVTSYGMIYANSVMLNSAITLSCPAGGNGKMRLVQ